MHFQHHRQFVDAGRRLGFPGDTWARQTITVRSSDRSAWQEAGGPVERFQVDGDSVPTDWRSGQPNTNSNFIACAQIQVVYGGVNLTTPSACATTTFS